MNIQIATSPTESQVSPRLIEDLGRNPITISNSPIVIALLKRYIETIEAIGTIEHSGDWDLNLTVIYIEHGHQVTRETEMGYANIEIGDLNDTDEEDLITNHEEITSVGFYFPNCTEDDGEPILEWIALSDIISIQVHHH